MNLREAQLFTVRLTSTTADESLEWILSNAQARRGGAVFAANVHTVVEATREPKLHAAFASAALVMPDGLPLVWALRSLGDAHCSRSPGPTLMERAMDAGRARGVKHYLFGGSEEACVDLKAKMETRFPGVQIAGYESPPFRPWSEEEQEAMLERMRASGANLFWIGLGAPKQELWLHRNAARLPGPAAGVGAAFDFLRGVKRRAPLALQKLGLEWLFRLVSEPRRLWKRYLSTNPRFLALWLAALLKHRFAARAGHKAP